MNESIARTMSKFDVDPQELNDAITMATHDTAFRTRMLTNPMSALKEAGVIVPPGVKFVAHEHSMAVRHIFLPPARPFNTGRGTDQAKPSGGRAFRDSTPQALASGWTPFNSRSQPQEN